MCIGRKLFLTLASLTTWLLAEGFTADNIKAAIENTDTGDLQTLLRHPSAKELIDTLDLGEGSDTPHYLALHHACRRGKLEHVKMMLEAGADMHKGTKRKETPLQVASTWGNFKVVRFLLKMGANASAQSQSGMNAVTLAGRNMHLQVLREFRAAGGDAVLALGSADGGGWSALKFAVRGGQRRRLALSTLRGRLRLTA
eukprot:TRINITY_DN8359_c0_g1_i1.p1 TRINITY_DN8359_c0_g1~~TRINITY_DN8359_c0_g1_i1.p1  ORF type:complete len:199 (-),score=27.88 TRINITY_DN8359_c0_g1_i1:185-781(-)